MSNNAPQLMGWPLDGTSLVEASAGTGKTWTLTGLYVRLVLEAAMPVDTILVVTYTEAATEELRGRIRTRLADVLQAFQNGRSEDELCRAFLSLGLDKTHAIHRLEQAISSFDQAAIYTIHGFCRRVLAETAFESKTHFDAEVLTSEHELLAEIYDDFWRTVILSQPFDVVEYLLSENITPAHLGRWVSTAIRRPYIEMLHPAPEANGLYDVVCQQGRSALDALRGMWPGCRERVAELLSAGALKKNSYRPDAIDGWLDGVERMLARSGLHWGLPEKFEKFTPARIAAATKKGYQPPSHPFFEACGRYQEANERFNGFMDARIRQLKAGLCRFVVKELRRRKDQRSCHSFDDLLLFVHEALCGPMGERLSLHLRSRFKAAMIDEFQDTDPVQLEIFQRIYNNDTAPRFLVGDPKQAIYSFRGADLFAYLEGRKRAKYSHTLVVNHRSDPVLVRAVNSLFAVHPRPFLFDQLTYPQVSGHEKNARQLLECGKESVPLRFRFLARGDNGKLITKERAREMVRRDVAAEIVHLLDCAGQGTLTMEGKPLQCGDIAVLVRSHMQAREMEQALAQCNVPSVRHGTDNVFASADAADMETVLKAVLEPGRDRAVKAALATGMLGYDAHRLEQAVTSEGVWEKLVEQFKHYHDLWGDRGFMPMLQGVLNDFQVLPRLLQHVSGERKVTNLHHLTELLQTQAMKNKRSMQSLLRWFEIMRQADDRELEEAQLRLESDADRVKIVTMHKAKGLEYPIVFCPYLWDGNLRAEKSAEVVFHDPEKKFKAFVDLGTDKLEAHREHAVFEELAESTRLLYVALTRARCRCYVHWGAVNDFATSPLAWLLHNHDQCIPADSPLAEIKEKISSLSDKKLRADLDGIARTTGHGIDVANCDASEEKPFSAVHPKRQVQELERCGCDRVLRTRWQVASFTGITRGLAVEKRDFAAVSAVEPDGDGFLEKKSIFTFPKGKRTGNCWHSLFEQLDFPLAQGKRLQQAVSRALEQGGFDMSWEPQVSDMVRHTLNARLDKVSELMLGQVQQCRRLTEMEFFFSVQEFRAPGLQEILQQYGGRLGSLYAGSVSRLAFSPISGFMHGFIDLVLEHDGRFYIVDYKSNHLGNHSRLYAPEKLEQVMSDEGYFLQYLLYSVALHRYLLLRHPGYDYGKHFGGVYYLFLRGIEKDPAARNGIFFDRPQASLIEKLHEWFSRGKDHGQP